MTLARAASLLALALALGLALGLTFGLRSTRAHAAPPAAGVAAALVAVSDADPLELARIVGRYGDAAVRALLTRPAEVEACLAAVRAAPMLARPELALAALTPLAAGRDSLLAPAAARATLAIASALDADVLAARESQPAELTKVRAALLALAARETAGADVRLAAGAAAEALRAAGVPDAPGAPGAPG